MFWIIPVSIGVIALAFLCLVVFLIFTLVSLRKTINTTNEMCEDLEHKVHSFDPIFRMVEGLGSVAERKTNRVIEQCSDVEDDKMQTAIEVAEWAVFGLTLWQKIKSRR